MPIWWQDLLEFAKRHVGVETDLEAVLVVVLASLLGSALLVLVALLLRQPQRGRRSSDEKTLTRHGFRRLRQLDAGAFAEIYRTRTQSGAVAALKVLRIGHRRDIHTVRQFMAEGSLLKRIEREARRMKLPAHAAPVRCRSYGLLNGKVPPPIPYIELEYVPGLSLAKRLEGGSRVPAPEVALIVRQTALCLLPAHALGIAHRDISPENLILENGDPRRVRLIDFGVAKFDYSLTLDGSVFGKARYMSPEQCAGEAVDHRSDLYSLGVVMYQMLAGRLPFQSASLVQLLEMHRGQPPPRIPPGFAPPGLVQLVEGLLEKDRARRWPASAKELVSRLDEFMRASR